MAVLISRLNRHRVGTRYVRRGLDAHGHAANSVEMEQIVFHHDFINHDAISSFVQMRGSAPLIWRQELDLSYRPKLVVSDITLNWDSIVNHFDDLCQQYTDKASGSVVCINLLDDKGFEAELTHAYEHAVKVYDTPRLEYLGFPVNKWCKKMNFKNMDILMNRIKDKLVNNQVFVGSGNASSLIDPVQHNKFSQVHQLQAGLVRVSCLDSLDRTNLTCAMFAKWMVALQVDAIVRATQGKSVQPLTLPVDSVLHPYDMDYLKPIQVALESNLMHLTHLWADSGDAISILYAGTRALKADVTRTGKRDWIRGSLDDGLNSLTRFYLNNFSDGRKQDAYDVWTGKVMPHQLEQLALKDTAFVRKARTVAKPIITKTKGIGYWLPPILVEKVDPLLQAASEFLSQKPHKEKQTYSSYLTSLLFNEHLTSEGRPSSLVGFVLSSIKLYAPEKVTNVFDFIIAMLAFCYVLVIVKIFQVKGHLVVDQPKLVGFDTENYDLD